MKKHLLCFVLLFCVAGMTMHAQQRIVLLEEFTSSTCSPYCPQYNNLLNPWLAENAEKVAVIKYQMNWPGAGDPYYTAEGGTRRSYYGVNGVPAAYVNGNSIGGSTIQAMFNNTVSSINNWYAQPAQAEITGTFKVSGNNITINGNVTPLISGSGYKIHVVVNEKLTTGNKGSNGEKEFHHVMMKMFPNGNGTDVTLESGTAIPFNYTYDMSTTHVEEMDDLEVAVFVQNVSTRAILNAVYLEDITPAAQNITATQPKLDDLNMNITWTPPAGKSAIDGYNVYRDNEKIASLVTATSYQDVAPEHGKIYTYGVEVVMDGAAGYTKKDTVLANVTMPMPTIVTLKQIQGKKVLIEWEIPETPYTIKYKVYRTGGNTLTYTPIEETSFTATIGAYGEFCFEIEPICNAVVGARSSSACITLIDIPKPANLKAEQTPASPKVLLTWDAVTFDGVAGYNIYRGNEQLNTSPVTGTEYTDYLSADGKYCYTVTAVVGDREGVPSTQACVDATVAICDIDKDALFAIYPNPVSGTLNINTQETITNCQIFNIQGQLIYSTSTDVKEVATDNWASGIYIIRITTENGIANKRFIKN